METKKTLGSVEVCAILEACSKAQVSLMKFGDLHVEFARASTPQETPAPLYRPEIDFSVFGSGAQNETPRPAPVAAITDEEKKVIASELRRAEVKLKDEQLAMAIIENPLLAEELSLAELEGENGELENVQSERQRPE